MIKDIKVQNENVQATDRVMARLHADFPQCFTNEGKFDLEKFKSLLNDKIDITEEGYDLNFLGKNYANLIASTKTETVIQPDIEHNSKPENKDSQNIYISGDNLDALKHLLKSYAGKIKCIYIDPPYNTGSDGFVYNDKFNYTPEQLQTKLGIGEGKAKRILDLCTRGSASHSAWLMFMAPRLMLARDLLTVDGVIFISIDDNEQANLKLLCDRVFGEENYIDTLHWKRKKQPSFLAKHTAKVMEYILVFAKNWEQLEKLSIDTLSDATKKVVNITNQMSIRHFKKGVRVKIGQSGVISAGIYTIKTMSVEYLNDVVYENGVTINEVDVKALFSVSQEKINAYIDENLLFITANYGLRRDVSNTEKNNKKAITDLLLDWGDNQDSDKEIKDIFREGLFNYSKPQTLISNIIKSLETNDSIILDFFSGSATTAHAVMKLNAEDEGNRKFIMVQLPEQTSADSEAHKAGYETIDQIGQERIRRAAAKIRQEHPEYKGDLGFKHFTLQDVAQDTLDKMDTFDPQGMFGENDILESFGAETVLVTWMEKDGYGLTQNAEPLQLADYTAYHCVGHIYMIDGEGFDEKAMIALVDKYGQEPAFNPHNVVLFGYSFTFTQTEMIKKNLSAVKKLNESINIDIRY